MAVVDVAVVMWGGDEEYKQDEECGETAKSGCAAPCKKKAQ